MEKTIYKTEMKTYKKGRKKAMRPWRGLKNLTCVLAVVFLILTVALNTFDNTLAAFVGGNFYKLIDEDKNAIYYSGDFSSVEEQTEYGKALVEQVEAEGAALLLNENDALPLDKGANVSLFSNSSNNLVYGGTGSGNVDASTSLTLKESMELAGLNVNEKLWDFYNSDDIKEFAREVGGTVSTASAVVSELPIDKYTDDVFDSVASYNDAAIVTLSRVGGEGADLTYKDGNYLALDANEKDLFAKLCDMKSSGSIKKIVVLINSANPLQVDFLKNNEYQIDAVLWIGDVGITGINAIGKLLTGEYNPSGSLVDTYCFDNYSSPAMQNFTPTAYSGDLSLIPDSADTYMIYQEGIYVGYKYYETRYEDFVLGTGNAGDYKYSNDVAFPFGYGLSYTSFELSDMELSYNDAKDTYTVNVKVTNTGSRDGKKTVQLYVQSPYTEYDINNGIEKASVALIGFEKTDILKPGASQTLSIEVDKADIASYDAYGAKTYILDEGTYYFTAASNSHEAVNNVLAAKGYTVESSASKMDAEGNDQLVASFDQTFDDKTYSVSKTGAKIENQLSSADINLYEGRGDNKVCYLSRNDWTNTWPKEITKLALTDEMIKDLQLVLYNSEDYDKVDMPTLGAKNGLKLYDVIGLDYDDPKWDALLDQMTFDEMVALIGDSFHFTMPVKSIEAPGTRDENGPQGLTASLFSGGVELSATAITSEDVMAATFNKELLSEIGKVIGNDCLSAGITLLYGPGNNIHRTPYGGRNFEYYSEDGFLSGKISAYEIAAIEAKGVHVVMKHFALNDCEQDRIGLGVWLSEQAAREIYLKAFQDAFEEGNAGGTMVAYTRWGCVWSGGNKGLMTGIMRNEWGSQGLTITDNVLTQYVNGVDALMAGGVSTFDAMLWYVLSQLPDYKNDPVIVTAMREACHHTLYGIANSQAMNGVGPNTTINLTTPKAIVFLGTLSVIFIALFILFLILSIRKDKDYKATHTKPSKN